MSDSTRNPLEIAPRIQDLYTDPSQPELLDYLVAGIDDNPNIDFSTLPASHRERIGVRFVVCTQVEGYETAIPGLIKEVDYLLIDSPYAGDQADRPIHDAALNAGFWGMRLCAEPPAGDMPGWVGFREVKPLSGPSDPIVQEYVNSSYYKDRETKPIIRTIGLGAKDQLPSGITIDESRESAKKHADSFETRLFTSLNAQLLERLNGIMKFSVPELVAVDEQLRTDIVTIIGNAIARSHWDEQLRFGVVLDARHGAVAAQLADIIRYSSIVHEPFFGADSSVFLPSAFDRAERETASDPDDSVSPATLERVLLSSYLEKTFQGRLDSAQKIKWAVRSIDHGLSDEEVSAFLDDIEGVKKVRISSVDLRRRPVAVRRQDKVKKFIWDHPHVVGLREAKL